MKDTLKEQFLCNPFPATAVARLSKGSSEFLNIETDSFKKIKSQVTNYLENKDDNGRTICIIGEYGTGKTHLALSILNVFENKADKTLHPFYLDAPSDNFLELYRKRFLPKLERRQVIERLDECYADVVANDLKSENMYSSLVDNLANRKISAIDVIRKFGLTESKYQRQFQEKLRYITEDPCFSNALILLQQPAFEEDIWNWFSGKSPTDALKERGIVKTINEDAIALEAIGVLAFLFGQQGHRFILLIDELEKVFSSNDNRFPNEAAMLAFKKLFETVGKTKALLILCGLPDYYEALPTDAQQRISLVIRPSALTGEDVVHYIKKANQKVSNEEILKPFTIDSAKYIASIAGGNARMVVRICYHAFQYAINEDKEIDRQIIDKIVQEQFGIHTEDDLRTEIAQIIERRGWLFESQKVITINKSNQIVDFWIPVANDESGIIITVVKSLISKDDCELIVKKSLLLKKDDDNGIKIASILIVGGYLSDNLRSELNRSFHKIILYTTKHFKDDLDSIVTGLRVKIEERSKDDEIAQIKEKLNQLDRQYRIISDFIMNELPTKKELLNSIQYAVSTSTNTSNKIHSFYSIPRRNSAFFSILTRINKLDENIKRKFVEFRFSDMRYNSSYLNGKNHFGYFYLLREMLFIVYNLIEYPQKVNTFKPLNVQLHLGDICTMFERSILYPLLADRINDHNFQDELLDLIRFYNDFNITIEDNKEIMDQLTENIRLLPRNIYNQKKNKMIKFQTEISDFYLIGYDDVDTREKAKSIYPELNEIFSTVSKHISYIDKKVKELITYLILIQRDIEISYILEKHDYCLIEFYQIKTMTYIFIESVNHIINSDIRTNENDTIIEICKMFDIETSRSLREINITYIFYDILNRSEDIVSPVLLDEISAYENIMKSILNELGRKTYKAIDKIYSTYKGDIHD